MLSYPYYISYPILSYPGSSYFSHPLLSYPIQYYLIFYYIIHPVLSYPILSYSFLSNQSYLFLSYPFLSYISSNIPMELASSVMIVFHRSNTYHICLLFSLLQWPWFQSIVHEVGPFGPQTVRP